VELYSDDSGSGKAYHDLLLRDDVSAVIIALPIRNQPEYIEAALKAGKHVLAEKPVAPDVAHAQKLISYYHKVAAEKKVTWAVAEQFRFIPKYIWAGTEIAKLGKLTGFSINLLSYLEAGTTSCSHHMVCRK
jgi:predicted dehydrogenase